MIDISFSPLCYYIWQTKKKFTIYWSCSVQCFKNWRWLNPSKIGFLHFYWFQMSTIFFSFCIFSQMLVNSLLTISFLGESLGFMLTHDVFSFVLAFIPTKIFKIPDEPLLPFQEFDIIKLRWNCFLMDSTDFSFYHIELNMIKKL